MINLPPCLNRNINNLRYSWYACVDNSAARNEIDGAGIGLSVYQLTNNLRLN